jgi:amino acid adenylation domain-containing protein/non-ribosomal peptide synthase protein (TIGR01720 family)
VSHHIILDGTSVFAVIVPELDALMNGLVLESPGRQYMEYTKWQKTVRQSQAYQASLWYWKKKLFDIPVLSLPIDRGCESNTYQGKRMVFPLPGSLVNSLYMLGNKENTSFNNIIISAVGLLMYQYTKQQEIVLGTVASGRIIQELDRIAGNFVNPLVLRLNMNIATITDLLHMVNTISMEAYQHQIVSFDQLVSELNPERIRGRSPLFQVPVVFQPKRPKLSGDWEIDLFKCHAGISKFELSFTFDETDDRCLGAIEYRTDLFHPDKIQRLQVHLLSILYQLCCKECVNDILSFFSNEFDCIARKRKAIKLSFLQPVHIMFEQSVMKNQAQCAVSDENGQLSYLELNARANSLACTLREKGLGKNDFIAVYMVRSITMVISILGVLKCGAAYVPIDPMYPDERIDYMLRDARCKLVLTDRERASIEYNALCDVLCDISCGALCDASCEVLCVSDICFASGKQFTPVDSVEMDDPAYCIYTSGSAGRPKGVVLPHRALSNHMNWMINEFGFNNKDIVLQKTPFSFDASIWEFFAPLLTGGQLVMAPVNAHTDINILINTIRQSKVTVLQGVPSLLNALAQDGRFFHCDSLRLLFSGGEALQMTLVNKILAGTDITMVNLYGPTEACIDATYWTCESSDAFSAAPIGYPVENCHIYILDKDMNAVPVGVTGELYIGGAQVALGYHNRDQMNVERFLSINDGRVYRTGDLAKRDNEGRIHFVGRMDNQVKYHGYRIELDEIEKVVLSLPLIEEAVVVLDSDQTELLCFYKAAENLPKEYPAERLSSILPSFMIPGRFVCVEGFPLTPNGKYDRKRLSAAFSPEESLPGLPVFKGDGLPISKGDDMQISKGDDLPISKDNGLPILKGDDILISKSDGIPISGNGEAGDDAVQNMLLRIWKKVLRKDTLSVHDDFYSMGGDSLLSMMVQSMANREGIEILAHDIFTHKTISCLAGYLAQKAPEITDTATTIKKEDDENYQSVLSHAQKYVVEIASPDVDHFCMAAYIHLPQSLDMSDILQIINNVINTHQSLRLSFDIENDKCFLKKGEANVKLDKVYLTTELDHNILQSHVEKHAEQIDVRNGRLMAGSVMIDISNNKTLLLTAHYLAADAVSWRIILSETEEYVRQIQKTGKLSPLQEDNGYLSWCSDIMSQARMINSSYWLRDEYRGSISLEKEFDGENTLESLACHVEELGQEETSAVVTQATALHSLKLTDVFLVALAETFGSRDKQLSVDLEGYGRDVEGIGVGGIDIAGTVGCFTVVYPVLLKKGRSLKETVLNISELRQRPGMEYSVLRYMSQDKTVRERLAKMNQSEISFNYMGIFGENNMLFTRSNKGKRHHYLEIDAGIANNKLFMTWKYCANIHAPDTIARYASGFISTLKNLSGYVEPVTYLFREDCLDRDGVSA